jgi:hypothetical protein
MDASISDAQQAELDHRLAKYERNPSAVIPWEQVREGLKPILQNSRYVPPAVQNADDL